MKNINFMMTMMLMPTLLLTLYWANLQRTETNPHHSLPEHPVVVASIKPIHSIVSMLTEDLYEPELIYDTASSVHNTALTPSKVFNLNSADLLIWAGPTIETSLASKISSFAPSIKNNVVSLLDIHGFNLKSLRKTSYPDMHFWLDINAVNVISHLVINKLISLDPNNKEKYLQNLEKTITKLEQLDEKLKEHFISIPKDKSFITDHDSLQYLELAYDLPEPYIISSGPMNRVSVKDLVYVFSEDYSKYGCVVYESEEDKKIASTIASTTGKPLYRIDASGRSLEKGPNLYFQLMNNITKTLTECMTK
jgi:zinc transport system substrate-binding protein